MCVLYLDAELFKSCILVELCLCYMAEGSSVGEGISQKNALVFLGRVTILLLRLDFVGVWYTNIPSAEAVCGSIKPTYSSESIHFHYLGSVIQHIGFEKE